MVGLETPDEIVKSAEPNAPEISGNPALTSEGRENTERTQDTVYY